MKLITKELAAKLPKLYEMEGTPPEDQIAVAKLFHPASSWRWYIVEYDGEDICYGLVIGHETELGYFSIKELSEVKVLSLGVERDLYFQPTKLKELGL
jgi:hypothetical protein